MARRLELEIFYVKEVRGGDILCQGGLNRRNFMSKRLKQERLYNKKVRTEGILCQGG